MKFYPKMRKFGVNVVKSQTWKKHKRAVCRKNKFVCDRMDWYGGEAMTVKSHELVE